MTTTEAQIEDIEVWPASKSMAGTNAYYHFCENEHAYRGYAVCLHTIKAAEESRLRQGDFVGCQRAISGGYCAAAKMREEERDADQALFYIARTNRNPANVRSEKEAQESALQVRSSGRYDMSDPSYARGWAMAGEKVGKPNDSQQPAKPVASPKPTKGRSPSKKSASFIEEGYADVVNAIQSEARPASPSSPAKEIPASPTSSLKPLPGETPVEFARRRAALLKSH